MGIMRCPPPVLHDFCENQINAVCKSSLKNFNVCFLFFFNNYSMDK